MIGEQVPQPGEAEPRKPSRMATIAAQVAEQSLEWKAAQPQTEAMARDEELLSSFPEGEGFEDFKQLINQTKQALFQKIRWEYVKKGLSENQIEEVLTESDLEAFVVNVDGQPQVYVIDARRKGIPVKSLDFLERVDSGEFDVEIHGNMFNGVKDLNPMAYNSFMYAVELHALKEHKQHISGRNLKPIPDARENDGNQPQTILFEDEPIDKGHLLVGQYNRTVTGYTQGVKVYATTENSKNSENENKYLRYTINVSKVFETLYGESAPRWRQ